MFVDITSSGLAAAEEEEAEEEDHKTGQRATMRTQHHCQSWDWLPTVLT